MSAFFITLLLTITTPTISQAPAALTVSACSDYQAQGIGCDFLEFDEPLVFTSEVK